MQSSIYSADSAACFTRRTWHQLFEQTKTTIALLYDEESENAYDIRLKLTKAVLTIQKQDVVCVGGSHQGRNRRTVTLRRQPVGGLGLSIKGGSEHNVPVVISKIFEDQAADQTGMLFVGDAVLQVNGIHVENATHEEVVHLLRNAGDEVTITVEYLREAPAFLKLPLGYPGPSSDHSSGASSPLFDSGLHLNGNSSTTVECVRGARPGRSQLWDPPVLHSPGWHRLAAGGLSQHQGADTSEHEDGEQMLLSFRPAKGKDQLHVIIWWTLN
ncbi:gamma-2-syntrophin isoform X13 [Homo sapiens]|uniref:gamma-2-syntrophin isoform X13 n=1 Tax=Homo sapiens TaxID=9606 RepID=UPI0023DF8E10|nr:gamma-2-syntrophin isoform X13 [Homo sapiens]